MRQAGKTEMPRARALTEMRGRCEGDGAAGRLAAVADAADERRDAAARSKRRMGLKCAAYTREEE